MLKIGITSDFLRPDPKRFSCPQKTICFIENDLLIFFSKHQILPVLIPDLKLKDLSPILNELDGYVFPAGKDLDPRTYNQDISGPWVTDYKRDLYELRIMDFAIKSKKPIFAICRGCQLMNVYFGGTLYQDIKKEKLHSLVHRDAKKYDKKYHDVQFVKNKFLYELYKGVDKPKVNSIHHQSIKKVGNGLEILAISPLDNVVESIGCKKSPPGKIIGVQWHPEFSHTLESIVIDSQILLQNFVNQVIENNNNTL